MTEEIRGAVMTVAKWDLGWIMTVGAGKIVARTVTMEAVVMMALVMVVRDVNDIEVVEGIADGSGDSRWVKKQGCQRRRRC